MPNAPDLPFASRNEPAQSEPRAWELRLYVAGQTQRSLSAIANLKKICEEYLNGNYHVEVIDLLVDPQLARDDQIVAIPTLVRKLPAPTRRIAGDLSDMEGTIQTLAGMVDLRDPYSESHQRNVANLAAAIGREIGLPRNDVEGIYFAGVVHDIGKLQVPPEILSKPGKLNNTEFVLIKAHAQVGHDIVKGVEFPWPVAQMILQHHERMDGSGYPNGLKGDAIVIGAKIIAVADVVEAMTAPRPYREALGIEAALTEIEKNAGILYDPTVVAACITLFRQRRFKFQ